MILPILNAEISVGDIFEGLVNHSILEVVDIKKKGWYQSPEGRDFERKETLVVIKDSKSGRLFETNLDTIKTLLMKRVVCDG